MFGWSNPSPHFRVKQRGDVAVVQVHGPEIRHPEPAQEFGADVLALLERDHHKQILLDLGQVRYMSSTGFAVLVKLGQNLQAAGGVLKLCNLHPDVAVGANIIGLGRLIETFGTEAEALDSFAS